MAKTMKEKLKPLMEVMGAPVSDVAEFDEDGHVCSYGIVSISRGKHKGKTGYYDDDDGGKGIVYFGVPFVSGYDVVKMEYFRPPTPEELRYFNEVTCSEENASIAYEEMRAYTNQRSSAS